MHFIKYKKLYKCIYIKNLYIYQKIEVSDVTFFSFINYIYKKNMYKYLKSMAPSVQFGILEKFRPPNVNIFLDEVVILLDHPKFKFSLFIPYFCPLLGLEHCSCTIS